MDDVGRTEPQASVERSKLALKDVIAIAGVGETDYPADHRRDGRRYMDAYGHAATALRHALADAGLARDDIDGLIVSPSLAYQRAAEVLGIDPRWAGSDLAGNAVVQAIFAIASGLVECVALVHGTCQRSEGVAYGGPKAMGGAEFLSYVQYAPWGLTSQGALYALMTRRYMELYGFTETDLAQVAISQRQFAALNPRAIMRKPLTLDDYLAGPFVVEPLRRHDYCLVNDGGVALIVTTIDRARGLSRHPVVTVSGVGRADENRGATSLRPLLTTFHRQGHRLAARQVYDMAGLGPADVDVLQVYDSFSPHVPLALEGFGFCGEGDAARFLREHGIAPRGDLPVNTSGGHLSESYMHGWNHQVEAVRQARWECGARQVPGCRHVQYVNDSAGKTLSLIYTRLA